MYTLPFCFLFIFADSEPKKQSFKIDGVEREAFLFLPAKPEGAPVVYGFHGHGGSMMNAARSFHLHKEWPEAVVVYMQGLNTPGALTDPEGKKAGWQKTVGDQGDRDLKFFDAVQKELAVKYKVDEKRVYATGHSNGGGFTYLLSAARNDKFAAFAPCAAGFGSLKGLQDYKPKPLFHLAGENDELVKFEFQKRTIEAVKKFNECESEGKEWAKGCLQYASKKGAPVVTYIHKGTHKYPEEAPALIVKFFKEHKLP